MTQRSPFILRSETAVDAGSAPDGLVKELSADEVAKISGANCDIHPKISSDFTLDDTWVPGSGGDFEACDD